MASPDRARRSPVPANALSFAIDPDALRALVAEVLRETLAQCDAHRAALNGKLAYSEPEAAALLSLKPHQLRDERLLGRISASKGPCRKTLYTREALLGYLAARRAEGGAAS